MDALIWLLDSDPAIRWQAMRDLTDTPPANIAAERTRVAHEGRGSEILTSQQPDGAWTAPNEPLWATTLFTLQLLRATGIDPAEPAVQAAMTRLQQGQRWNDLDNCWELRPPETGGNTFFEGEEEPCINGGALGIGAYFGLPSKSLLRRLLTEQLKDGGWNCEAPKSTVSSFHTTICVLEGLLEYERAPKSNPAPDPEIAEARHRGEEYLLERSLFRRLSTGEVISPEFLELAFPPRYRYDILRALDYFRATNSLPDPRMSDAVQRIESRQLPDGRWPLDRAYDDTVAVSVAEPIGEPSRWNTLRALRVLRWYRKHEI